MSIQLMHLEPKSGNGHLQAVNHGCTMQTQGTTPYIPESYYDFAMMDHLCLPGRKPPLTFLIFITDNR